MLGQQRLELTQPDAGPVLDPRLGEIVRDGVETVIHARMIDFRSSGYMGRTAHLGGRPGLFFMKTFLIVNPRSGTESPSAEELREAARGRGVNVHFLEEGE